MCRLCLLPGWVPCQSLCSGLCCAAMVWQGHSYFGDRMEVLRVVPVGTILLQVIEGVACRRIGPLPYFLSSRNPRPLVKPRGLERMLGRAAAWLVWWPTTLPHPGPASSKHFLYNRRRPITIASIYHAPLPVCSLGLERSCWSCLSFFTRMKNGWLHWVQSQYSSLLLLLYPHLNNPCCSYRIATGTNELLLPWKQW